jgi:hypothetical protein
MENFDYFKPRVLFQNEPFFIYFADLQQKWMCPKTKIGDISTKN